VRRGGRKVHRKKTAALLDTHTGDVESKEIKVEWEKNETGLIELYYY